MRVEKRPERAHRIVQHGLVELRTEEVAYDGACGEARAFGGPCGEIPGEKAACERTGIK